MPGMAAGPIIFEHLDLPASYEIHWLDWKQPKRRENIVDYAQRIAEDVHHDNVILIGVSLGGVIVQEMSRFITVKKLILISSVKTKYELPGFMRFGRRSKLYKLLPNGLVKHYQLLKRLPFSKKIKSRLSLYERYITITNRKYLNWGVDQILNWDREEPEPGIIHIHGDKDHMFPIKNITNCFVVKGGSHIMIINRFKWFNEHLPNLIEKDVL